MSSELFKLEVIIMLILSYIVGSIPFGLILAKFRGIRDIRSHGSGNIGATNVLRVAGKFLGLLTLILDMSKGIIIVLMVKKLFNNDFIIKLAMIIVILGHIFPIWLKGKGGKGVATALASLTAYNYIIGAVGLTFWIITFLISRISSLSSIITFFLLPFVTLIMFRNYELFFSLLFLSSIIICKHSNNIIRLLHGTESKISSKTKL